MTPVIDRLDPDRLRDAGHGPDLEAAERSLREIVEEVGTGGLVPETEEILIRWGSCLLVELRVFDWYVEQHRPGSSSWKEMKAARARLLRRVPKLVDNVPSREFRSRWIELVNAREPLEPHTL